MIKYTESGNAIIFAVRVVPRSSRSEIVGVHDGALKIKLKAPPVEGAANDELVRFLSKALSVSRSNVEIISGTASRSKRIAVKGVSAVRISSILQPKI